MSDFFGDTGWDGSLDEETPVEPVAVAEAPVEPVAEAPEETPEAVAEPEAPADDRERDAAGRFLPKKPTPEEIEAEKLANIAAKFSNEEELKRAYLEAQRALGNKTNEVGELRAQLARIEERVNQPPPAPPQQITQELIDYNPAAAAQLAFEQGNQTALQIAFQQWKEDDPADAVAWSMTKQMEAREQALRAEIEAVKSQYAPLAQSQEDAAFARVIQETVAADPGVLDRIQAGAANIAVETAETLYSALEHGTPTQKIGAFRALAELTRGRDAPATLDVRTLAREQALAADEAIAEAAVVTANSAKSEPAGKTMADVIGEEWDSLERPLADGWNIGR